MTTREVLIAARAKISDPTHWLKGALATDDLGNDVQPCHASKFCMIGAVVASQDNYYDRESENFLRAQIDGGFLDTFNDSHTHAEVLALFDTAIAAA